jgi:uncharacterized protein YdaL
MVPRVLIFISLAIFSLPLVVSAQEPSLIEAMCQQVLEPEEEKSVLGIVKDHIVGKFSDVPEKVVDGAKGTADSVAESLAEKIESQEVDTEVAGASIINPVVNEGFDALGFLMRHWLWTIAGLGLIVLYFLFR